MRKAAHNSTFAIGGVSCSADSLVVAEILCSASTLVVKIPPIANAQNVSGNTFSCLEKTFEKNLHIC